MGQLSHASPTPSRSPSSCSELCTIRQLSIEFNTPVEKKEASGRCEHKYGKTQVEKKGTSAVDFQEDRATLWDEPLSYRECIQMEPKPLENPLKRNPKATAEDYT